MKSIRTFKLHHLFKALPILITLIGSYAIVSCQDEEKSQPAIDSITPSRGIEGDVAIIRGHNLTPASDIKVLFGNVQSEIISLTDTTIEVVVPGGEKTVRVLVDRNGERLSGPSFVYKAVPTLTIEPLEFVTTRSALIYGELLVQGTGSLEETGVVYSTSPINSITDGVKVASDNYSLGKFSANIDSLKENTSYYVRAFAQTQDGVGLSEQLNFKTFDYEEWFITFKEDDSFLNLLRGLELHAAVSARGSAFAVMQQQQFKPTDGYYPVELRAGKLPVLYKKFPGEERYYHVLAAVDQKLFFGLGRNNNYKRDFWQFDIGASTWTHLPDFPEVVHSAKAFVVNNEVFILGNPSTSIYSFSKVLYKYNALANKWEGLNNLSFPFTNVCAAFSIGENAYSILSGVDSDEMYKYNLDADSWTQIATLPAHITPSSISAFSCNGKVLLVASSRELMEYDPNTNHLAVKQSIPIDAKWALVEGDGLFVVTGTRTYGYVPRPN